MESEAPLEVVELHVGDTHTVELAGLGTAGYSWAPEELEGAPEVATVSAAEPGAPEESEAVGASATEAFTLRARRPGVARVRFAQRRPWETTDVPPAGERLVEVRVIG